MYIYIYLMHTKIKEAMEEGKTSPKHETKKWKEMNTCRHVALVINEENRSKLDRGWREGKDLCKTNTMLRIAQENREKKDLKN